MNQRGFTLVETIVALAITAAALTALAQLLVIAAQADADARRTSFASILAAQKTEELRSLGADLAPQGSPSLNTNTPGVVDFIDEYGRSLGTGSSPPAGTVYVRRWSVEPIPTDPDTFVIQVAVFPRSWRANGDLGDSRTHRGAHLVTVKTRRAG